VNGADAITALLCATFIGTIAAVAMLMTVILIG
jgi:hypothetical protein